MLFRRLFSWTAGLMLTTICCVANGQSTGSVQSTTDSVFINGRVLDETKEGIIGAIVQLKADSVVVSMTCTDENGNFHLYRPLAARNINISYPPSHLPIETPLIKVKKPYIFQLGINPKAVFCDLPTIFQYRIPLIDPWGPTQRSFTSEEIEKMAR